MDKVAEEVHHGDTENIEIDFYNSYDIMFLL
jgi:hypothetical protein